MLPVASLVPVVQTQIGITFDCFLYLCSPYGERFVGLSGQSERLYLDVDVEPNHPKLLLPQGLFFLQSHLKPINQPSIPGTIFYLVPS